MKTRLFGATVLILGCAVVWAEQGPVEYPDEPARPAPRAAAPAARRGELAERIDPGTGLWASGGLDDFASGTAGSRRGSPAERLLWTRYELPPRQARALRDAAAERDVAESTLVEDALRRHFGRRDGLEAQGGEELLSGGLQPAVVDRDDPQTGLWISDGLLDSTPRRRSGQTAARARARRPAGPAPERSLGVASASRRGSAPADVVGINLRRQEDGEIDPPREEPDPDGPLGEAASGRRAARGPVEGDEKIDAATGIGVSGADEPAQVALAQAKVQAQGDWADRFDPASGVWLSREDAPAPAARRGGIAGTRIARQRRSGERTTFALDPMLARRVERSARSARVSESAIVSSALESALGREEFGAGAAVEPARAHRPAPAASFRAARTIVDDATGVVISSGGLDDDAVLRPRARGTARRTGDRHDETTGLRYTPVADAEPGQPDRERNEPR